MHTSIFPNIYLIFVTLSTFPSGSISEAPCIQEACLVCNMTSDINPIIDGCLQCHPTDTSQIMLLDDGRLRLIGCHNYQNCDLARYNLLDPMVLAYTQDPLLRLKYKDMFFRLQYQSPASSTRDCYYWGCGSNSTDTFSSILYNGDPIPDNPFTAEEKLKWDNLLCSTSCPSPGISKTHYANGYLVDYCFVSIKDQNTFQTAVGLAFIESQTISTAKQINYSTITILGLLVIWISFN